MKQMTLLEKARKAKKPDKVTTTRNYTRRDREEVRALAVAYARKELTGEQVTKALGYVSIASSTAYLGTILLTALRHGEYHLVPGPEPTKKSRM